MMFSYLQVPFFFGFNTLKKKKKKKKTTFGVMNVYRNRKW